MTSSLPPVLLVGCGRMGGAMLAGWREQGLSPSVAVDPASEAPRHAGPDLLVIGTPAEIPSGFTPEAVVFAVKPQNAAATLPDYAGYAGLSVFLSIMAGRTIGGMQAMLGTDAAIVRAMPNTPAAVHQAISVACAGPGVSTERRNLCSTLLSAIGTVAWVEDEALLDAVTAVSGSGPAYVFLLAELLEQAAEAQGIPRELARMLARQTVSGSGALLAASNEDAASLRHAVTSLGGTTAAALQVLMASEAWPATLRRAVEAATKRSQELAG
ncbi:MAG: pyrroline-5-carboxylate reductase [Acetobacteraceae bacterium]|nr:pyrroline-5-carboxylate reductase [Acetobacteraceae bacterium]